MEDTKDVDRPDFFSIQSYEEFSKYYWYRLELSRIRKKIDRVSIGPKSELNNEIRAYFMERDADTDQGKSRNEAPSQAVSSGHGKPLKPARARKICDPTPEAPLLDCEFAFKPWFREYFAELTGIRPFRFTADMATAWRKVKQDMISRFPLPICSQYTRARQRMRPMMIQPVSGINFIKTFVRTCKIMHFLINYQLRLRFGERCATQLSQKSIPQN